jgi:hypothetical protein
MSDSKTPRTTKQIAVSSDAWEKARKIAGLRKAKGQDDADMGAVATEAILDSWSKLPAEVRDFLDHPEPLETAA